MEKIKIFTEGTGDTFASMEVEVNRWLRKNKIKITSRHATSNSGINAENNHFINLTIVIFYKVK